VSWIFVVTLAGALVIWIWFAARLARLAALLPLTRLPEENAPAQGWPRLSVVVACRNEEATVERALGSLATQDYPALEIIAVDDRSTDRTAVRLEALAARAGCLRVVRVAELPAGWLGKTHALHRGQEEAAGELLLFTDADVVFEPGALRRAVGWFTARGLGHGVLIPRLVAPGFLERGFVALFGVYFLATLRTDELGKAGTRAHVGLGAFNLVAAAQYRRAGGHHPLRFEVVDDLRLGLVLRRSGVRQGVIDSGGLVRVRWQEGLLATMNGMLKNYFAVCEYRWGSTLFGVCGIIMMTVLPVVALAAGVARPLAVAALLTGATVHAAMARRLSDGSGLEAITLPLSGLALALVGLASAALATIRRAVIWRGTRYPLSELRAGCVRDADWPPDRAPAA
jgi:hypothetical protein